MRLVVRHESRPIETARIPWPTLLKARRDYVRWQAYLLWVRAIEESGRSQSAMTRRDRE